MNKLKHRTFAPLLSERVSERFWILWMILSFDMKKCNGNVVGTQDNFKIAGYSKSSKHRKAEELITKGIDIRILSEDDFKSLTNE